LKNIAFQTTTQAAEECLKISLWNIFSNDYQCNKEVLITKWLDSNYLLVFIRM